MSVAYESNTNSDTNRIRQPGFAQGMWIYNSSETARFTGDDHRSSKFPVDKDEDDHDSSSSSSIGNNSDASGGEGDSDDDAGGGEVQSLFKGSLNNLCALEQALPIKRGISTFYAGKSKSYTSLADAVSAPSIQDIGKPEDAYNRKRKNIIAHGVFLDKNRNFGSKTGISKRSNNTNGVGETETSSISLSSSPNLSLPPLPSRPTRLPTKEISDSSSPRIHSSPWRSYSLSDLQHAAGETSRMKSSLDNIRDKDEDD
ncbi:unnamed protein product [Lactuca saligna]|uniref:Uncharacterized protein n=1 Tax=Lactuca saligna TaxID=75948 RepID=A0AA35Y6W7_LACSI|nr:unnamed protein product [Lactuca saligna]